MNPLTRWKFDRALDRVWQRYRDHPKFYRAIQSLRRTYSPDQAPMLASIRPARGQE